MAKKSTTPKTNTMKAAAKIVAHPAIAELAAEAAAPKAEEFNTGPGTPDTKVDAKVKTGKKAKPAAAPKAEKTKRVSLNPQPVIDAKVAAVKELGLKLTYAGRQWKCGDRTFTSLEFSRYDVEGFKKLFAK
jgi:hypothetical protein